MTPFSSGRINLPPAISAVGLLIITVALFFLFRPPATPPDKAPNPPAEPSQTVTPPAPATLPPAAPAPKPTPVAPTLIPAEKVSANDLTSRNHIAEIKTSEAAAATHHALTRDLIARLEQLDGANNIPKIRVAVQELADLYYLLDRAVRLRKLDPPGAASVTLEDKARIEHIVSFWTKNMEVALTVDQLFRERELLTDEHVSQMLRRWMEESS